MLAPDTGNKLGVEKSVLLQQPWIEKRIRPAAQGSSQPFAEGDCEAHLRAIDEPLGNIAVQQAAENALALRSLDLEVERKPPGELKDSWIEEWSSCFQRNRHGRAI